MKCYSDVEVRGWLVTRVAVDSAGRKDKLVIGPWWAMLDYLWRDLYVAVCKLAIRVGAARKPSEGCYYHELEWWPRR